MRKLMWFTIGFAIAAAVGAYLFAPTVYFLAAGACAVALAICLIFLLRFPKARIAAVVLFGCILGFAWQVGFEEFYLSVPRVADGMKDQFTIYALDYSEETDYGAVVDGAVQLNGKTYRIRTYLPEDLSVKPGDRILGYFTFRCTLPGCTGDLPISRADGVFLTAYPLAFNAVEPCENTPWYGYPAVARQYLTYMMQSVFPEDVSGFARALLLGDSDGLDYETDVSFKVSGIRHIIAVSGLHVTILFSLVFLLTGKRNVLASIIGIPILFAFAAIAGFSPSITRACIMHGMMALAMLFEKEYDPPSALSFAVLVMLVCNPWVISSVSFQLSVGCMIGILCFTEPIQNWLMDRRRLGKWKGIPGKLIAFIVSSISVSISATLVTTPLCAYYFGMVSLVSIFTNLLTLWVVTFAFYGIVVTCTVGLFSAGIATAIGWVVAWPMRYILQVAKLLSAFPLSAVYMESIYMVFWLVLCYVLLAVFLLMERKRPLIFGCCCTICLCIALFASWTEPLQDECRVTVLDVGQGQCILLQSDGKNFLVDCGGDSETIAADEAAGLLLSQGIYRLDGMILTHYDADHAAGVQYLLSRIPADYLYLPVCKDTEGYAETLANYSDGVVQMIRQDTVITFGTSKICLIPSQMGMTDNESGLCILYQTQNYDILITGDRGISGEKELLRHMQLPQLEVLIVGHHGSKFSTGEELLEVTQPQIAIISVSADNKYGHPAAEVLQRLEKYGCVIYRTDQNGTVVFRG